MTSKLMKAVITPEDINELLVFIEAAKATDPEKSEKLTQMLTSRSKNTPLNDRIRHEAKTHHNKEGEVEFDEDCTVSIDDSTDSPDGAYVQAWVWVGNPDLEDPTPFRFPGLDCEVIGLRVGKYSGNNAMAVAAILKWKNPEPGESEIEDHVVSVNVVESPDVKVASAKLPEGEFYLKSWSENERLAAALEEHGIIQRAGHSAMCGYGVADSFRITPKGQKWVQRMQQ